MTQQSNEDQNEITIPEIDSEEDARFDSTIDESNTNDKTASYQTKDTSL